MKKILRILMISFGFLLLGGCAGSAKTVTRQPPATPQAAVHMKTMPAANPPDTAIRYNQMQVAIGLAEITTSYMTEYGTTREPPAQQKFLWVRILLNNTGSQERSLPATEHFSVLYASSEYKPSYGHRIGKVDYTSLKPVVYPGQVVDAWLRFEIPAAAGLQDLQAAFLPESFQVSFANPESGYSWADHPLYLWRCIP
jgi:hypothetical protein